MFKINNIPIGMKGVVDLFYKTIVTDTNNKYLEFSDLATYAISNITEEKYRNFMRNFKELQKNLKTQNITNEVTFLPMNFHLLLEHFHTKGLLRENIEQVRSAMKKMEALTKLKQSQLNSKTKITNNKIIERENKIHKQIDLESIYNNFQKVVSISEQNIDKIMKKNNNSSPLKLPNILQPR